jgi:hypothetical protein
MFIALFFSQKNPEHLPPLDFRYREYMPGEQVENYWNFRYDCEQYSMHYSFFPHGYFSCQIAINDDTVTSINISGQNGVIDRTTLYMVEMNSYRIGDLFRDYGRPVSVSGTVNYLAYWNCDAESFGRVRSYTRAGRTGFDLHQTVAHVTYSVR